LWQKSPAVKRSEKLFAEARRVIPGGVNSPVRAWKSVGGAPRFVSRGQGARITDVDGRSYVDMVCSWGPLIFGHAYPSVVRAVQEAASRGVSFGAPTPGEVELAREITSIYPSIEKVRLVSSGTEATMSAIRVARAFTGKPGIVKFAGFMVTSMLCSYARDPVLQPSGRRTAREFRRRSLR
jgi:glutamate-1-semialdehyde 2,1-aminomutase